MKKVTQNSDTNGGYRPNMNEIQLHDSSFRLKKDYTNTIK